ncbi:MAG: RidA family protein [Pseudomonadota bacterium]
MRRLLIPAIACLAAACETVPSEPATNSELTYITTEAAREAGFPFSPAVEVDGWVFLSGALGTGPGGGLVPGGIGPESRQTMDNIEATLTAQGLGWDRVVKCSVFLADIAEWPAFNEVYKTYFDGNYPARSALGASGLALDARVEIECIAKR